MELRQLEYFVTVADQRSFTRAAELLHVAQPGVSSQLRQLEREIGQDLLDRSGRRVRLTAAGAAVLPYARAALSAAGGVREVADELAELRRGQAAFGMVTGCGGIGVPDLLAAFHAAHPAIEISLLEDASDRLAAGVRDGSLDVALIGRQRTAGGAPRAPGGDRRRDRGGGHRRAPTRRRAVRSPWPRWPSNP